MLQFLQLQPAGRQTAQVKLFGSGAVFMAADHTDGNIGCQSHWASQTPHQRPE